jgi:hypothetical protein
VPGDVDAMWEIFAGAGIPPFKLMDRVGLDVVLAIEEHYASVRSAIPEGPRELLREYLDRGWPGVKSGRTPGVGSSAVRRPCLSMTSAWKGHTTRMRSSMPWPLNVISSVAALPQ